MTSLVGLTLIGYLVSAGKMYSRYISARQKIDRYHFAPTRAELLILLFSTSKETRNICHE